MRSRTLAERDPFAPVRYRYPDVTPLYSSRSEFQTIEVYDNPFFGRILVLDGVVQLTQRDEFVYHEMLAHVPLHSHPAPKRVLVIGGGDGGTLREVLKHPTVERAVLCELDQMVIEVARKFFPALAEPFDSPRVEILIADGAKFMRETSERFDAILVDSTDPVGPAQTLSSKQFFETARQALTPDGLFAMQSESLHYHVDFVNYMQRTLREVFPHTGLYGAAIATYAGNWWTFSMGSKSAIAQAPVRPAVPGTRLYCDEVHRSAFIPAKVLACFTEAAAQAKVHCEAPASPNASAPSPRRSSRPARPVRV